MYFYSNQLTSHNYFIPNHPIYLQSQDAFGTTQHRTSPSNSSTTNDSHANILSSNNNENYMQNNSYSTMCSNNNSNDNSPYSTTTYNNQLPSAPPVPSMIPVQPPMSMYGYPSNSNAQTPTSMMNHYN